MANETLPDQLFFVTLTPFSSSIGEDEFQSGISFYKRKLEMDIFGQRGTKRGNYPMTFLAVFEKTLNLGVHAHCIIGIASETVPANRRDRLNDLDRRITNAWCSTNIGGVEKAQDVQRINDLNGVFGYIMKEQRRKNLGGVDLATMNIGPHLMEKMSRYVRDNR